MADRPIRHLRVVYNGPRSEHFQDGVTTGRPKISPNHPAWGSTPWEERFPDGGQEDYPEPETQTSGAGGSKKPPTKKATALGDEGEKPKKGKGKGHRKGSSADPDQGTLFNLDDYR